MLSPTRWLGIWRVMYEKWFVEGYVRRTCGLLGITSCRLQRKPDREVLSSCCTAASCVSLDPCLHRRRLWLPNVLLAPSSWHKFEYANVFMFGYREGGTKRSKQPRVNRLARARKQPAAQQQPQRHAAPLERPAARQPVRSEGRGSQGRVQEVS